MKVSKKLIDDFNYLYDQVGWGAYDKDISKKALENTLYSVSKYDGNKIIGFGRIVGDGICFLYIQDVMVLPSYQGKKIGSQIMKELLEYVEKIRKENLDVRVYLGASKGVEGFYKKFGFVTRAEANLGSGMIYLPENNK